MWNVCDQLVTFSKEWSLSPALYLCFISQPWASLFWVGGGGKCIWTVWLAFHATMDVLLKADRSHAWHAN